MAAYNQEMFAKISASLNTGSNKQSNYANVFRMKAGNTYTVRLLPNVKEPAKTIFHYYSHGWNSLATGQFVSAVSPSTWGERDPIDEAKFRLQKSGTEEEMENSRLLTRRENWLINIYVVNDPTDPENNGKVKMLRYGKQLHKIITSAIEGEDSDEFGARVFDLSPDGCSLKIKVEEQGGFSTYVSSRFTSPSKIAGLTDDSAMNEIYNDIHDLEGLNTVKSYDELKDMLDEHFFCKEPESVVSERDDVAPVSAPPVSKPASVAPVSQTASVTPVDSDDDEGDDDDKVKAILDSMDM